MFGAFSENSKRSLESQERIEAALDLDFHDRQRRSSDAALEQEFNVIQRWQSHRLLCQYDYLLADHRTATAAQFMIKDVYSGDHLALISNEIRKTASKAWRLVSTDMIDTAADAIEAHVYTQRLDQSIATYTQAIGGLGEHNSSKLYVAALSSGNILQERQAQLIKFRRLAHNIQHYLKKSSFHIGLKMTGRLARKAGVYNLHQFLSKACFVLRDARDINYIIDEVTTTELKILDQVTQGENPFRFMDKAFEPIKNKNLVPSL